MQAYPQPAGYLFSILELSCADWPWTWDSSISAPEVAGWHTCSRCAWPGFEFQPWPLSSTLLLLFSGFQLTKRGQQICLLLGMGSLSVLTDAAAYVWEHLLGKQKLLAKNASPPALSSPFYHSMGMCKSNHSGWRYRQHPITCLCRPASQSHLHSQPKFLRQSTVFQSYPPSSSFETKMKWGLFDLEKIPFKEKEYSDLPKMAKIKCLLLGFSWGLNVFSEGHHP